MVEGRVLASALKLVSGLAMAAIMLPSLALVCHVLLMAKPVNPTSSDGQTLAILVCGLAVIGAYTLLFSILRTLLRKVAAILAALRPFQSFANLMSQDHRNRGNLKGSASPAA